MDTRALRAFRRGASTCVCLRISRPNDQRLHCDRHPDGRLFIGARAWPLKKGFSSFVCEGLKLCDRPGGLCIFWFVWQGAYRAGRLCSNYVSSDLCGKVPTEPAGYARIMYLLICVARCLPSRPAMLELCIFWFVWQGAYRAGRLCSNYVSSDLCGKVPTEPAGYARIMYLLICVARCLPSRPAMLELCIFWFVWQGAYRAGRLCSNYVSSDLCGKVPTEPAGYARIMYLLICVARCLPSRPAMLELCIFWFVWHGAYRAGRLCSNYVSSDLCGMVPTEPAGYARIMYLLICVAWCLPSRPAMLELCIFWFVWHGAYRAGRLCSNYVSSDLCGMVPTEPAGYARIMYLLICVARCLPSRPAMLELCIFWFVWQGAYRAGRLCSNLSWWAGSVFVSSSSSFKIYFSSGVSFSACCCSYGLC